MNLRRKHKEEAEVSTESLNDIMFFLLLFFLIISTLANPNVIKLMLPKSANNEQLAKQQVNLGVTKDKQYSINKKPVPFDQLEAAILAEISGLDQPTIVLNFDRELSVQDLVDVMQIGTKIKVKMVLATQKQS
ncbi:MAG: biopolymer transporter ExbD [Flavobacteriales bacterium]|nr:biopolymer transporter ExbD [Flavobacteriales bacterium]MBL0043872.1 biopolymer transporter ExbD [Flavobacteriales bacterium]